MSVGYLISDLERFGSEEHHILTWAVLRYCIDVSGLMISTDRPFEHMIQLFLWILINLLRRL